MPWSVCRVFAFTVLNDPRFFLGQCFDQFFKLGTQQECS